MYDAVLDCDVFLLLTEWKEFRFLNWQIVKMTMSRYLVIEGRNLYDRDDLRREGFKYHGIGI